MRYCTFARQYLDDVKAARSTFAQGSDTCLYQRYVLRPLSFVMTPLFVNMGFSANQVTCLRGIAGAMSLLFWALGGYASGIIGAALFTTGLLLDDVDGDIARFTDTVTYFGKFLDGMIDTFVSSLLSACIGWGLYTTSGEVVWFVIGVVTSILVLFSSFVRTRLSFFRDWVKLDYLEGKFSDSRVPNFELVALTRNIPIRFVNNYRLGGLIVAAIFDLRQIFLIGFCLVSVAWALPTIWNQYIAAKRLLNFHRYSRHSARREPRR